MCILQIRFRFISTLQFAWFVSWSLLLRTPGRRLGRTATFTQFSHPRVCAWQTDAFFFFWIWFLSAFLLVASCFLLFAFRFSLLAFWLLLVFSACCFLPFASCFLLAAFCFLCIFLSENFLLSAFCFLFLAACDLLSAQCSLFFASFFSLTALSFPIAAICDCCFLLLASFFLLTICYFPSCVIILHQFHDFHIYRPLSAVAMSCIIINNLHDCSSIS